MRVISLTSILLLIGVFFTPWAAAVRGGTQTNPQDGDEENKKSKFKFPSFKRGSPFKRSSKLGPAFKSKSSSKPVRSSDSTAKNASALSVDVDGRSLSDVSLRSSDSDAASTTSSADGTKRFSTRFLRLVPKRIARNLIRNAGSIIFLGPQKTMEAMNNYVLFKRDLHKIFQNPKYAVALRGDTTSHFDKNILFPGWNLENDLKIELLSYPKPRLFIFDTSDGWKDGDIKRFTDRYNDRIGGDTLMPLDMNKNTEKQSTEDVVDGGSVASVVEGSATVSPLFKTYEVKFSRRLLKLIWKSDTRNALKKANSIIFYRPSNLSAGNVKLIQDETRKVAPGKVYLLGAEEPLFVADGLKSSFTVVHSDAIDLDTLPQPRVFITNTNAVGASTDLRDFERTYRKRVGKEDILIDVDLEEEAE